MVKTNSSNTSGALSDVDIKDLIQNKEIVITPFAEQNLTPLGYNLSFTKFIYSVNNKMLNEIFVENNKLFCYIEPNDTVLIIAQEAIWVSKSILGTFHSKVGIVSKGFGHISTTLDPDWEGPLLFSLNNPTNQRLKIEIAEETDERIKYKTFVTLILYKMKTCSKIEHDNKPARVDILKSIKNSLGTTKDDQQLLTILNNFKTLEIVRIGLSEGNNLDDKISEFKKKYKDFNIQIGECIKQVNTIRNKKVAKKKRNKYLTITLISIYFLGFIAFAINSYMNNNYEILSLLAIINAFSIFVAKEIYMKIMKG